MTTRQLTSTLIAIAFTLTIAVSSRPADAASSSSVVGATVLSATSIDAAGCTTGALGKSDFGPITAGSTNLTTIDCNVAFGSSNDTAQLRMRQTDGLGGGMWMPTRGQLDQAFDGPLGGANGKFIEPIGTGYDYAYSVAVQPDGRIVTAGRCFTGVVADFCLARYNEDGTRDTTFDGPSGAADGEFLEPIGADNDYANAVAVQPNGRIVAVGSCTNGMNSDFCLARYNADGSRDTTFDGPSGTGDGEFLEPIGTGNDYASAVLVQLDGRIVVAGYCDNGANIDFCLARYNPDGSRDTTFDGPSGTANGEFLEPIGAGNDAARAVAVQLDGRLVVAGTCNDGVSDDFCLARYESDGSRDATFDGPSGIADGEFLEPIGASFDQANAVAVQPDGRILVAGKCRSATNYDFCLARYEANGSRDLTFDGPSGTANGEFIEPIGPTADDLYSMVVQSDGRIVLTGTCWSGANYDFCLARYNVDGSRDTSFDGPSGTANGEVIEPVGANDDFAYSMAVRPDGRIIAAGYCDNGANNDFCLASFDRGGAFDDYVTGGGSDRDFLSGATTSFFGACLRAVSGGASATWVANDPCPSADGAFWNDVPAASEQVARTTALEPNPPDATAHLRFALRAASSQPAGDYIAPITFDVLAPNA